MVRSDGRRIIMRASVLDRVAWAKEREAELQASLLPRFQDTTRVQYQVRPGQVDRVHVRLYTNKQRGGVTEAE